MQEFRELLQRLCSLLLTYPRCDDLEEEDTLHTLGMRNIRRGMTGSDVVRLQIALRVEATGHFDLDTDAAVRKFQLYHGIYPSGVVGPATRKALGW